MKIEYYVNEDKHKVVCVLSETKNDFIDLFYNKCIVMFDDHHKGRMPDSFAGVATCAPTDNWNIELGKKVAYNKAKNKYDRAFFQAAQEVMDIGYRSLDNFADRLDAMGDKFVKNRMYRIRTIDTMLMDNK